MKITIYIIIPAVLIIFSCSKIVDETFDYTDGNAGFAATEIAQSGKAILQIAEEGRLSGKAAGPSLQPDSLSVKLAYNISTGNWVGNTTAIFTNGTVSRIDTIRLMLPDGTPIPIPSISLVDSIWHKRSSTLSGNNNQATKIVIDVESNALFTKTASDTTATINGVGTTKFAALNLSTTTVIDLVYSRSDSVNGEWGLPESGMVNIERPFRTIDITFTGETTCTATVTKKTGDKASKTFTINLETGEEIE